MITARTVLDITVYLCISVYLITRVAQGFFWLEKSELGTIYKMALPGYVEYPSLTICPAPTLEVINAMHIVNETWKVPKPTLDVLTQVTQSYYQNDK